VKRRLSSGEVVDADELELAPVRPPPPAPAPRSALPVQQPLHQPTNAPRTDLELLEAIMSRRARLTTEEARSFDGMLYRLRTQWTFALSYSQRAWAQEVGARVGLDVDAPEGWREVAAELRRSNL